MNLALYGVDIVMKRPAAAIVQNRDRQPAEPATTETCINLTWGQGDEKNIPPAVARGDIVFGRYSWGITHGGRHKTLHTGGYRAPRTGVDTATATRECWDTRRFWRWGADRCHSTLRHHDAGDSTECATGIDSTLSTPPPCNRSSVRE